MPIRFFWCMYTMITKRNFDLTLCFSVREPGSDLSQNGQKEELALALDCRQKVRIPEDSITYLASLPRSFVVLAKCRTKILC